LCFYFLTEEGLQHIRAASPGGAGRNRTLGLAALNKIKVPLPSIEKQLWFDELQTEADQLSRLQGEAATDLDALLASSLNRTFKDGL
jgi:type I restriction enzyme S subunit